MSVVCFTFDDKLSIFFWQSPALLPEIGFFQKWLEHCVQINLRNKDSISYTLLCPSKLLSTMKALASKRVKFELVLRSKTCDIIYLRSAHNNCVPNCCTKFHYADVLWTMYVVALLSEGNFSEPFCYSGLNGLIHWKIEQPIRN